MLDRGRGEKERERNTSVWLTLAHPQTGDLTWPATPGRSLTGNPTSDPLVHRLALHPLSHTSRAPFFLFDLKTV